MVGTNRQWVTLLGQRAPVTMADVILDQKSDQEIWDLYGEKWKPSVLIEGAFEAEVFFLQAGQRAANGAGLRRHRSKPRTVPWSAL
jgi:hypothetical protein